jgi:CDP-4-dehydro-6-deoxyglucose reductase, E1
MTISLAEDTISHEELESLSAWILAGNRLTKNGETLAFEAEFEEYMGVKHAIVTNSGSSSNLLMIYALKEAGYLRNNKVIAPAVSWVTTVSPLMQFGFDVSLCECDAQNLGLNIDHLEQLCKTERPALIILVHVLGHANHMDEIQHICKKYDVLLIEDSCESLGSELNGRKLGGLSTAGSFSFYYGHHISTVEGGMVVTNDTDLYHVMLSLRSHGWSRDLPAEIRNGLMAEHGIDEFRNLYTFYYPGFNLRSTDLQAFIGRSQLKKLDRITVDRERNYNTYRAALGDFFCQTSSTDPMSSFAYGTLIENRNEVFEHLSRNDIECRPLICGNIGRHPFWAKRYGDPQLKNADIVHDFGIYMPNHHNLSEEDVRFVCETFKQVARPKHF